MPKSRGFRAVALLAAALVAGQLSPAGIPQAAAHPPGRLVLPPRAGAARGCSEPVRPGIQRYAPALAGQPGRRTVALTFDDGPGRSTAADIAVLRRFKVTATFFNLGVNESRNAATVRAELSDGYALGDHTWDHQDLTWLSASGQRGEMTSERSLQSRITGAVPCLFRPPYGSSNATTVSVSNSLRMTVWDWSVDTEDWKASGSPDAYWVNRIVSRAEAGGSLAHPVILFHNQPGGNPATVAALPQIIRYYQARGYTFVDLFGYTGPPSVTSMSSTATPHPARGSLPVLMTSGGLLTLRGTGFGGVLELLVGGKPATWLRVPSSGLLYAQVGARTPGVLAVVVVTTHGRSAAVRARVTRPAPPKPPAPTPTPTGSVPA